jgi:hypothetical protein
VWGVGVDIGKHTDHSAIMVVELVPRIIDPNLNNPRVDDEHFMRRPVKRIHEYIVRYMERLDIGTDYVVLRDKVAEICGWKELLGESRLVVDVGNAGDALWEDWERMRLRPVGIRIKPAGEATSSPSGYNVAKVDLVGILMRVFSSKRIRFASFDEKKHPESARLKKVMIKELTDFRMKHTPRGNATYEARSGEHDDMTMALAVVLWYMEKAFAPLLGNEGVIDERDTKPEYDPLWS